MIDKDFKTKIKTFSNKELLEQIDFMTEGYYSDLIEICLEELRCRLEATEWHYPSKGEYPPKNKHLEEDANVLCLFNNGSRDVAWYIKTKNREGWLTSCGLEPAKSVKCWQYIVPPKGL